MIFCGPFFQAHWCVAQISASLRQPEQLAGHVRTVAAAGLLWHAHGSHMPLTACASWLAPAAAAVAQLQSADASQRASGRLLWSLRFLQQLAAHVPADPLQQGAEAALSWQKVWQVSSCLVVTAS